MRFAVGPLSFCQAEQCLNRSMGGVCSQSGLWKNRSFVESYIAQIRRDPAALALLRQALSKNGFGSGATHNSDALLKVFAEQLASGRLRVCGSPQSTTATPAGDPGTTSAAAAAESKPFPLADRSQKTQGASSSADQPSFPSDVELAALADVLTQAASSGVPFCEECLRAAQGR